VFLNRKHRRTQLMQEAPPPTWYAILQRRVPYVARLTDADRGELFGKMQVFLAEKHFEGCGGLELTDEIKVTIAAQACILLLHRETEFYPGLDSILVYPHAYVAPVRQRRPDGTVFEGMQARLG